MKNKFLSSISILLLFIFGGVTAYGADYSTASPQETGAAADSLFSLLAQCSTAMTAAIIAFAAALLLIIFRHPLAKRLEGTTSNHMLNAFIVFFSISGLACFALGLATDGQSWSHMMHTDSAGNYNYTQFQDFMQTVRHSGASKYSLEAARFSPFSLLIFTIFAQFMPNNLIFDDTINGYLLMLKNQTCMLLYLFVVILCLVAVYRMSRSVLRRNGLTFKNELTAFLMIVSFPTMYCIELGNIAGLSYAFVMFFILFWDSEVKYQRELAILLMGASAAITPYTLIFALLLITDKEKRQIFRFVRTVVYFVCFFIFPAFITGFRNMLTYVTTFLAIPEGFQIGNTSVVNLLTLFGVENKFILYAIFLITELAALLGFVMLPKMWQKTAAATYIILNLFSVSDELLLIFMFIPFIFLISEKKHRAIDWLYLGVFTLTVTPFPQWYYFDSADFKRLLAYFSVGYVYAANNLVSLAAVQFLLILITYQAVIAIKESTAERKAQISKEAENGTGDSPSPAAPTA